MAAFSVLLDATAVPADRGGVGRYVDGLVGALARTQAELSLVCQRLDAERYRQLAPNANVVAGPGAIAHRSARLAWEQTGLPLVAEQVKADLIHCPAYTMPIAAGRPVVVTVHDATMFSQPEFLPSVRGTFLRSATRTSLRRSARCIVPSKATRNELVRLLDADATRLDVAYHGVDVETFHPPSEQETRKVANRLGLHGRPYVAFLGALEPRHNVPGLVRAWMEAARDRENPPALVLAGGPGWDDAVDQAIAEVPLHLRVVRPGYLRYQDLRGFLGGALVVAYPSFGEGFGLPVLEAMACGAPILTTHRLSLPEVGGDAVLYAEPDVESLTAGLNVLFDDEERRRDLGAAAHVRSREFTWEASADAHLAIWARAIGLE
jgi:glycosyltransferase involved in cell wall biosynthesis